MVSWMLVMLLAPVLFIAVAVAVITAKSRQQTPTGPLCGNCGYNLTGSTTNRCPECGELFVDAGIIKHQPPQARKGVVVALVIACLAGLVAMFFGYAAMRRTFTPPVVMKAPASAPAAASQPVEQTQERTP